MTYTKQLSETLAVVATVDPQVVNNTSASSDYVDMENFRRVIFVIAVGATDTTVDAKIQEAQDASGTGAQDLSGKAITQLSATDDNKQAIIEVAAEELSDNYTHVKCVVTAGSGSTGAYVAVIGLAGVARYEPASDLDLASVAEIVT